MGAMKDGGERMSYGNGGIREPETGKGRFDLISMPALWRLARWYELGAAKYADRNWEKGIPKSRCISAAFRHLMKAAMGWNDEDHLAAVAWNVFAIMHFEDIGRIDLMDMPDMSALIMEVATCAEEAEKDKS